jgi:hypothetical protein
MADVVTTQVLLNGHRRRTVLLTNVSDGTGEAAVKKVDKSDLTTIFGAEPALLRVKEIEFCIQGFAKIILAYDHDADQTIAVLSGTGKLCFEDAGVKDLGSAGGTGDILLTAPAGATTGSYTILLELVW